MAIRNLLIRLTDKIREAAAYIAMHKLNVEIEVDGGVNWLNVCKIIDAGADVIVAGSLIFNGNTEENMYRLRQMLDEEPVFQD